MPGILCAWNRWQRSRPIRASTSRRVPLARQRQLLAGVRVLAAEGRELAAWPTKGVENVNVSVQLARCRAGCRRRVVPDFAPDGRAELGANGPIGPDVLALPGSESGPDAGVL